MFKILVIDDEVFLREMLRDIFTHAGYEVIVAQNGNEGLDKIHSEKPDLVLLDCQMPVMDGYEVLTQLKKEPRYQTLPVIMLTAMASEQDEIKGLNLGLDDYITKPFKTPILVARVKTILERKKASAQSNPLTSLAGNIAIQDEVESRIKAKKSFALLYIDISNFKSFNDRYGFDRGDDVIKYTAGCLLSVMKTNGDDFIGHVGGDDFVFITTTERAVTVAEEFISRFDEGIKNYYDDTDRNNGYIMSIDRNYNKQQFPIMSVSVAIISTQIANIVHYGDIARRAAELKKVAKQNKGSSYVFEKRR
ncbi:MAG: response regulator [Elusimicrobia bacterium]|nr:response regulator [Elusimicrobiota bacterium]